MQTCNTFPLTLEEKLPVLFKNTGMSSGVKELYGLFVDTSLSSIQEMPPLSAADSQDTGCTKAQLSCHIESLKTSGVIEFDEGL